MRRQSKLKRFFKGLLWTVAIILCLHIGTTAVLKWAVNNKVAALRRAGEPVYAEDMVGPAVPDAQNGAIELAKAINALESKSLPPNIAGHIRGYNSEELGGSDGYHEYWWKQTERELSSVRHIVSLVEAGIAKPAVVFADDRYHSPGDYYSYDPKLGRVARFFRLNANCDARNGRMHAAAETIIDMMAVSRKFLYKTSPAGLSRYSYFYGGAMHAAVDALKFGVFSEQDASEIDEALASVDVNRVMMSRLREKRVSTLTGLRDYVPEGCILGLTEGEARIEWTASKPFVLFAVLRFLRYTDAAIATCSRSAVPSRTELLALSARHLRGVIGYTGLDERFFKSQDVRDSYANLTRIAIKIKSYKRDHGAYPACLSELGSSIPTDPVTGKPYGYTRIGKGFAVYGKGDQEWYSVRFPVPTLRQQLDGKVLIGWVFKN